MEAQCIAMVVGYFVHYWNYLFFI